MDKAVSGQKRMFFAFEVNAPWPEKLPEGRIIAESDRHLTLAFLGSVHFPRLENIFSSFPKPPCKVGMVGQFDHCLFLPPRHSNVVAWDIEWFDKEHDLGVYQKAVIEWLQRHDFDISTPRKDFLPHVTISRRPFDQEAWQNAFTPLPMMVTNIHLYESLGNLIYQPRWTYSLKPPFEEIDHTADVAYRIRGESLLQVHRHALIALAFLSPSLLSYLPDRRYHIADLDDLIIDLNTLITEADSNEGVPLKAVSFHGELKEEDDQTLVWEMIIDV